MKAPYPLLFLLLVSYFSFSQTEVPSFFADNMVLQQKEEVSIWGWDAPGTTIEIHPSWGQSVTSKTTKEGRWTAVLQTENASFENQTIRIEGSSTIEIKDVLIGEVWFCSGQSNMEMPVKGFDKSPVNRSETFLATSENPNIRLFNAPRSASLSPENNIQGKWEGATKKSVSEFSAIGYFFGRKLYQALRIPIGIIESSWGGTQIEAWLPKNVVSGYPSISIPKNLSEDRNEQKKPTALYNAMIHPFQDYGIRGILWYQGESNRNDPVPYKGYMHHLVEAWRTQWNRPELPFYMVQIAPYGYLEYRDSNAFDANLIREAQALAAQEIPNAGIAITTDVGKCDDIHPPEKEIIAGRLANMALAKQYGIEDLAYGSPEYKAMEIEADKIELSFGFGRGTKENRQFDTEMPIKDFVIAGKNQKFYPAKVSLNDDRTLTVYSEKVKKPVAVRYGFVDCLKGSFFSRAGLPVSPFRTDSWDK